jgi:hypothetical protein
MIQQRNELMDQLIVHLMLGTVVMSVEMMRVCGMDQSKFRSCFGRRFSFDGRDNCSGDLNSMLTVQSIVFLQLGLLNQWFSRW